MAKIKFGMMMTDARGKLGGQVFSKNRSGAYIRTKVTPVNPRTISQQANRSLLGTLSSGWSGLNDNERATWNGAVEQWQSTNVFGDLQKPSGKNLFTSLNKVRLQYFPTLPIMATPLPKIEFGVAIGDAGFFSIATNTLSIGINSVPEGTTNFAIRATPVVSAGTTFVKNLLRVLQPAVSIAGAAIIEVPNTYSNKFGTPRVGDVFFVEVRQVANNGQLGVPSMVRVVVEA